MKARQLAEERAKQKIDKLNSMIEKWEKKDKKVEEIREETINEKKFKLEQMQKKRDQAKLKYEKMQEDIEKKGIKNYMEYLKELKERKAKEQRKMDQVSENDYIRLQLLLQSNNYGSRYLPNKSILDNSISNTSNKQLYDLTQINPSNYDLQYSLESSQERPRSLVMYKRRKSETARILEHLEDRMRKARERSEYKRQQQRQSKINLLLQKKLQTNDNINIQENQNQLADHKSLENLKIYSKINTDLVWSSLINRSPEVRKQIELDLTLKMDSYVQKRQKYEKFLTQKHEMVKYQKEAMKEKQLQKQVACAQLKKEYEAQLDQKRKLIEADRLRKNENVDATKYENEIHQIKKIESSKLKMQDLKEQYEEVRIEQLMKKERIIRKHQILNQSLSSLRQSRELSQETRAKQMKLYLEHKLQLTASPYEEMKIRFLKNVNTSQNLNKSLR
eukprot:403335054